MTTILVTVFRLLSQGRVLTLLTGAVIAITPMRAKAFVASTEEFHAEESFVRTESAGIHRKMKKTAPALLARSTGKSSTTI